MRENLVSNKITKITLKKDYKNIRTHNSIKTSVGK